VNSDPIVDRSSIEAAAERLLGHAHRTPVLTSTTLNDRVGAEVFVKCENFQRAGAFKFRGAYNAIACLPAEQRSRGVATYSSGNHGQAVSLAAREFGVRAVVLMPADAPASKVAAVRSYGGEVVDYDRYTQDRKVLGEELANADGLALIPPYEHPDVIAGQGTVGLELSAQAGPLDVVVAPLGGGGLMAGVATAVTTGQPGIKVVGVEPATGNDHALSMAAGERVQITVPHTIADGLAVDRPGELTFAINRRLLDEVLVVSDEEIVAAMRFLFDRMKLVVEPSGAASIAGLLSGRLSLAGSKVGVVISGGNVDTARFVDLMNLAAP
jgi:threo-3-hydroxy-L-aspartate ammonia-lyase